MNAIKERILGAITVMDNSDAEKVWDFMVNNLHPRSWDEIEEITPDDWDLKMLDDMNNNPDCHEFISQEELLKKLGLVPSLAES